MKITNWLKKNAIAITYILTILSDTIFEFTKELDLTNSQLNIIKAVGAIIAVLLTNLQAIVEENKKQE